MAPKAGAGDDAATEGPWRLIVEADGGSRGNPGVAGYGALVRDPRGGRVLAQRAEPLGTASNNVAEYSGLIAGLELALRLAGDRPVAVEVRMDSKLVVEQMSGRWKVKHPQMRRLADDAKALVARIAEGGGSCRFAWVPRASNTAADRLSNLAMDGRSIDRVIADPDEDAAEPATAPDGVPDGAMQPARGSDVAPAAVPDSDPSPRVTPVGEAAAPGDPPEAAETGTGVTGTADSRSTDAVGEGGQRAPRLQRPPDRGTGARVVLLRHGVTDATAAGRMDGRGGLDLSLNAEGTRQARLAAAGTRAFLGAVRPIVIASGLRRAQETARHVAAAFDVPVHVDDDWDELDFGDWNGRTMREVWTEDPDGLTTLLTDPAAARPGGESRDRLAERVARAVEDAVRRGLESGEPVVAVTHRGAIVAALAHVLGIPGRAAGALETGPASLTSFRRWSDGEVLVEFVNDRSHLRPV